MKEIPKCWREEDGTAYLGHVNKNGKMQSYIDLIDFAENIQEGMNAAPGPVHRATVICDGGEDDTGKYRGGKVRFKVWNQ